MTDPTPALNALVMALNARAEGDSLPRAFDDGAVVFRQGWGLRFGHVQERFEALEEIAQWMRRSPVGTRFSLASEPQGSGEEWTVRYRVTVESFENFGTWRVELSGPRIRALWHQPDNLPGMPEPAAEPPPPDTHHKHD